MYFKQRLKDNLPNQTPISFDRQQLASHPPNNQLFAMFVWFTGVLQVGERSGFLGEQAAFWQLAFLGCPGESEEGLEQNQKD